MLRVDNIDQNDYFDGIDIIDNFDIIDNIDFIDNIGFDKFMMNLFIHGLSWRIIFSTAGCTKRPQEPGNFSSRGSVGVAWSCSKAATQLGTLKVRFSCAKTRMASVGHRLDLGQGREKMMNMFICISIHED